MNPDLATDMAVKCLCVNASHNIQSTNTKNNHPIIEFDFFVRRVFCMNGSGDVLHRQKNEKNTDFL